MIPALICVGIVEVLLELANDVFALADTVEELELPEIGKGEPVSG
jgi:hypothetical protein